MASELKDASIELLSRLRVAAEAATERSAEGLIEKMQAKLNEPKSGRTYGAHSASAPGEAPATDTGTLERALHHLPARGGGQEVFVGEEASYAARYLEEGSPGGKIAPRPWFWPAVEAHRADYTAELEAAINGVLR